MANIDKTCSIPYKYTENSNTHKIEPGLRVTGKNDISTFDNLDEYNTKATEKDRFFALLKKAVSDNNSQPNNKKYYSYINDNKIKTYEKVEFIDDEEEKSDNDNHSEFKSDIGGPKINNHPLLRLFGIAKNRKLYKSNCDISSNTNNDRESAINIVPMYDNDSNTTPKIKYNNNEDGNDDFFYEHEKCNDQTLSPDFTPRLDLLPVLNISNSDKVILNIKEESDTNAFKNSKCSAYTIPVSNFRSDLYDKHDNDDNNDMDDDNNMDDIDEFDFGSDVDEDIVIQKPINLFKEINRFPNMQFEK